MLLLLIKDSFENANLFAVLGDFLVLFSLCSFFCSILEQKFKDAKAFHNENKELDGSRNNHNVTNSRQRMNPQEQTWGLARILLATFRVLSQILLPKALDLFYFKNESLLNSTYK